MSIQLLFLQQRCNPSMLNGGREGCSHPGLRVVHDSFHPPSGETVFSASDGCFFEAPGEDLLVYGCANTSLNQFPFAFAKTSIQTHFHLQSCYPPDKDATDLFYLVYGCANASLNKFPFARAKTPIQTHFHLQSCYPQTKKQHCSICSARGQKLEIRAVCLAWCTNVECACTPPEAELQRSADENKRGHNHCVLHSARTVHAQCTLQCTSQCTATKRCKYHVFSQK